MKLVDRQAALVFTMDDFLWYQLKPRPEAPLNLQAGDRIGAKAEENRQLVFGSHLVWGEGLGEEWPEGYLELSRQEARDLLFPTVEAAATCRWPARRSRRSARSRQARGPAKFTNDTAVGREAERAGEERGGLDDVDPLGPVDVRLDGADVAAEADPLHVGRDVVDLGPPPSRRSRACRRRPGLRSRRSRRPAPVYSRTPGLETCAARR